MYWCLGLSHSRDRTSCFFLLNFMRFLLSHVRSLSRSFYEWQCNCWRYQQLLPLYLQIALGAACPIIQVIDEHVKQHYPQCPSLRYITGDCSPAGCCNAYQNHLSSVQPVFNPPHCPFIQPVLHWFASEDVLRVIIENLTKVKIKQCQLLHPIHQDSNFIKEGCRFAKHDFLFLNPG